MRIIIIIIIIIIITRVIGSHNTFHPVCILTLPVVRKMDVIFHLILQRVGQLRQSEGRWSLQRFEAGLAYEYPVFSRIAQVSSSTLRCSLAEGRRGGYILQIQLGSPRLTFRGTLWANRYRLGNAVSGGVLRPQQTTLTLMRAGGQSGGGQSRHGAKWEGGLGLGHRWATVIPSNLGQVSEVSLILTFNINDKKKKDRGSV